MTTSPTDITPVGKPETQAGTAIAGEAVVDAAAPGSDAAQQTGGPAFHERSWFRLALIYTTLVTGAVAMLVPFFIMIANSLMPRGEANNPGVLIPSELVWSNYPEALGYMDFFNALANTTFITFFAVVLQVITCSLVGLGFARYRFRGREPVFMLMLATMMIPPQVTMIPVFLL